VSIAATPVFVDATGRRVKAARVVVRAMTALLLILVAVTAVSLIGRVPMPGLARPVTVPVGETPRPNQELDITNQDFTAAPAQRADVPQSAQTAFERDNQSPPTSAPPDPAKSILASVPQTPTPRPTQTARTARTASSGPTTPAPTTAAPTPASTPQTPAVRPTPANRPVQPRGQSGSHGRSAQHGPPTGHGPKR
jgi:cell division protein FtsN